MIRFGPVLVETAERASVVVVNRGQGACTIREPRWDTRGWTPFSIRSSSSWPVVLGPQHTLSFDVEFLPPSIAHWKLGERALWLETSDGLPSECSGRNHFRTRFPGPGCKELRVWGFSVGDELVPAPLELDLGEVEVGCGSVSKPLVFVNQSGRPISLESIELDDERFRLQLDVTLPRRLEPWESISAWVAFHPQHAGWVEQTLRVRHDGVTGSLVVPVHGTGSRARAVRDAWTQRPRRVDIVLVVDSSAPFRGRRDLAQAAAASLVSGLANGAVDFHLAVMPVSEVKLGSFLGSAPAFLTAGSLNLVTELTNRLVTAAEVGNGAERALEGVRAALTAPGLVDARAHRGFLREDAALALVTVNVHDDRSLEPVEVYVNALRALKGLSSSSERLELFALNPAQGPSRLLEAVEVMGGEVFSSEEERSISAALAAISNRLASTPRTFALSRPIERSAPVSVWLDGKLLHMDEHFRIHPVENELVFDESQAPLVGSRVEVAYDAACLLK